MTPRLLLLSYLSACVAALAGCVRATTTEMTVLDPREVGIVGDEDNRWRLPPGREPEKVEVYRNLVATDSVVRTPDGGLDYVSRHWSLGTIVDVGHLVDAEGHVDSFDVPPAAAILASVDRDAPLRLGVSSVPSTGRFGCDKDSGCRGRPAVPLSLVTPASNVGDVTVARGPMRGIGVLALPFGSALVVTSVVDAGFALQPSDAGNRDVTLAVGAGLLALGGALVGAGLWYLLAPEHRSVVHRGVAYRP